MCGMKHKGSMERKNLPLVSLTFYNFTRYNAADHYLQNHNIKLAFSLLKYGSSDVAIEVLHHKFLVSGQLYLPNDSDFGTVESASATIQIYVPEDWYTVMAQCRHQKKFLIVRMQRGDLLSTSPLTNAIIN